MYWTTPARVFEEISKSITDPDNISLQFKELKGDELKQAIIDEIKKKPENLKGSMQTQGTTPRRLTDLIGSLCDLTSGSGDKGTPVVFIQGYFDNLASE